MSKKILIVDDDESILDAVSFVLTDAGYQTKILSKGEGTKDAAIEFQPDAILLDVLISGVDGRTICKELKNDPETKKIPVILTSAHPSAAKNPEKNQADDFLAKPFEVEDLLSKIKKQINKK